MDRAPVCDSELRFYAPIMENVLYLHYDMHYPLMDPTNSTELGAAAGTPCGTHQNSVLQLS